MTPEEQQMITNVLTFEPSEDAVKLAKAIAQYLQQYEQTTATKSMIPAKEVSDFAMMTQKLMVQYLLQAQNDMVQHTTNIGAILFQQMSILADAQIEPEPVTILAVPPEMGEEIQEQLEEYTDFLTVLTTEAIPVIEKALAEDASEEVRTEALKALKETNETAQTLSKDISELASVVEEGTYDEEEDYAEAAPTPPPQYMEPTAPTQQQPVVEDEYEELL